MTIENAISRIRQRANDEGTGGDPVHYCDGGCGRLVCDPAFDFRGNPIEVGYAMNATETAWLCEDCATDTDDD